ncbi:MAG: hypothetical protein M3505_12850, partial [Verrucomicrobiota bacterium]|nr:hypothetical protein [Verrucomicrobiota bacterium]
TIAGFCGCAGTATRSIRTNLFSARFRVRTPKRPGKGDLRHPAGYQVHRLTANGQTFYVYKNESADLALVGREAEYQRFYREMAGPDRRAENDDRATEWTAWLREVSPMSRSCGVTGDDLMIAKSATRPTRPRAELLKPLGYSWTYGILANHT